MESAGAESTRICHVVAMPYPGRGHINPMMNLCKLLVSKNKDILVTFVVTEEWLSFIGSEAKPDNIRFSSIPNVVPSERVRAADMTAFFDALMSQMEAPFERLLDRLEPSPRVILADTFLLWVVGLGNRRNIKVSSFWPMSASMFSIFQHFHLLAHNGHFPVNLSEKGMEHVDYIPGVSSTRLVDFPPLVAGADPRILHHTLEAFTLLPKAQCITFPSIYELEPHSIDVLRAEFSIPIYTVGPAIPYFHVRDKLSPSKNHGQLNYLEWLDCQPPNSVLYISLGSYIPVCSAQMDEIAAGLKMSGVSFLWVARGETEMLKEKCGDKGLVVPWCEQLRVLCHGSVGGFWSHCGWNSIREGVFGGVPFLALPLAIDQGINAKIVVEDWKVGWRVKKQDIDNVGEGLVKGDEIADLVKRFMDLGSEEGKEMRRRIGELQKISHDAIAEGTGSSEANINAFIRDICQY
ncbi:UDP-glycosyltransferase 87A1-like [Ziziphus jujuba]|uniref:UDP-glycosyltransferase 87A1-like n=1 Tax=Ziziphus jujuba TaxID=326968 RepID=A0A6P3ZM46_ZIZJJ|nr:UDP-glycosyltransferase 87A1-like [Ziziphus jujuba]